MQPAEPSNSSIALDPEGAPDIAGPLLEWEPVAYDAEMTDDELAEALLEMRNANQEP